MMDFTNDELNLMCIYSVGGSREALIQKLTEMKQYLESDEEELLALTDSTISKLEKLSDSEFTSLELIPDFDS